MNLPTYKSHKTVQAMKIASIELRPADFHLLHPVIDLLFPVKVNDDYVKKHAPQPGGYFVLYEDGYQSYSPAAAFESGYTQCDGPGAHETKTYPDGTVASGPGPLPDNSPTSDANIEAQLQAKGLTAPRLSPADLNANIVHTEIVKHISQSGQVLRWAVLTTRNGFAVTGRPSASVSPENDDIDIGQQVAINNARQELWPLMGYQLRENLFNLQAFCSPATTAPVDHQPV